MAAGASLIAGLGLGLSACGGGGTALAQQACAHITRSISLLHRSEHASDQSQANRLSQGAYDQLRAALPLAAQAAYHDGQWQALMTTISESNRVPESTLVTALSAQCQQADQSGFEPPPRSIPPPPTSSSPSAS
ncbi:MAG: hypothetical protein ACYCVN_10650 [Acidimicrobiales bacterium]